MDMDMDVGWEEGGIGGPNPMQALGPEEGGAGHNGKVPPTQGITPTVLGFMTLYSPTWSSSSTSIVLYHILYIRLL